MVIKEFMFKINYCSLRNSSLRMFIKEFKFKKVYKGIQVYECLLQNSSLVLWLNFSVNNCRKLFTEKFVIHVQFSTRVS